MLAQLAKLEAHTSHLLDAFIGLRERYAILHPMLFGDDVPKLRGSGSQARGFMILRHSLFLSCAQDIAKLSLDGDKRTPSIKNLVTALEESALQKVLRERFAVWVMPQVDAEPDPEIREALKRLELREQAKRRAQFDELLAGVHRTGAASHQNATSTGS